MTPTPTQANNPLKWFALTVRRQHEGFVLNGLADRNIESFFPATPVRRQWSDRVKTLEQPLFSGYVFCRCGYSDRLDVLNTPGVASFVSFGKGPAAVPDAEIESIRTMIKSGLRPFSGPYIPVGSRVRIARGPLAGVEGVLARAKQQIRVFVNIDILQRSVSVELNRDEIAALGHNPCATLPEIA